MSMPQLKLPRLACEAGDMAPPTHGVTFSNTFYSLEAQAGRPVALIFAGEFEREASQATIRAFAARSGDLAAHEADVVTLVDMQSPYAAEFGAGMPEGMSAVFCEESVLAPWGGRGTEPFVVVLDRGSRVVSILFPDDPAACAHAAVAAVAALPVEAARDIALPAPTVIVPHVFSPQLCAELIQHFEASQYERGGMASRDASGAMVHKIDESKKRRYDFVLGPRDPYIGRVLEGVIKRVLPEVRKAFQVDVAHTDRLLIARYDDDGGYFRRHRDNAAPGVEFRQFALSINLNADYDGGALAFPEYNSHRYRPAPGAGVVFSCSLLHEATPVTRGRRYVLLTFLHDAAAQQRWLQSGRAGAGAP